MTTNSNAISRSSIMLQRALAASGAVLVLVPGMQAQAQYDAEKVSMFSRISVQDFGASSAADCWGYTSASGREYAIVCLNNSTAFVEITDPSNPVIVHKQSHSDSFTGDVKMYGDYAYSVGDYYGLQIFDLSDIDNGNVRLARSLTHRSHNIAINEDSGFAYLCASSVNYGISALDLSDPENPVVAGSTNPSGNHVHDAEVISYTSGPYAGREIAFCPSGQAGLDIIDMTDKSNMTRLSHTTYDGLSYCHQSWLDADQKYLYVDDEIDELDGHTPTTRTLVFDVSDLSNPVLASTFTSGSTATDHNLYLRDGFIFEANYRSGLRIFDARDDALDPPQVGWFDTFPGSDAPGYNGAWNVYPFFDSGTVIVSDIESGLFVLDVSEAIGESDLVLRSDPLVSGKRTSMRVDEATPNEKVYFIYSLAGKGSTEVKQLNVTLDLAKPKLAGSRRADANGSTVFATLVPGGTQGLTVWRQAAEYGRVSNVLEDVVE